MWSRIAKSDVREPVYKVTGFFVVRFSVIQLSRQFTGESLQGGARYLSKIAHHNLRKTLMFVCMGS